MKRLTIFSLIGLLTACSAAEPATQPTATAPASSTETAAPSKEIGPDPAIKQQELRDFCKDQSLLAASVMNARQSGMTMAEMMEIPKKGKEGDGARALVIDSFKYPKMNTESNQQSAISEFENQTYLQCIEALIGAAHS